ncbi:MAG: nucleotidyltransferase domain-containing protein [Gemmataceae bacterium]|nr:nucleotidyltransferase domain-containing protein [Gemmataceae bacterium]
MTVSPEMIARVRADLAAVEAAEGVRVLYAVESGSRAWGFPSADSDYDVRLVYVRRPDWYLSIDLESRRDVIEHLGDPIDLAGWDVRKALKLFAKSNPPLLEWLDSPVVYADRLGFADRLRGLAAAYFSPAGSTYHYLRMARNTYQAYLRRETVRPKKYFYALRPLLGARWVEQGRGPVPMLFPRLLDTIADDAGLRAAIDALLVRKSSGVEMEEGPRDPVVHAFIDAELDRLAASAGEQPAVRGDLGPLNELFREYLARAWADPA